MKKGILVERFQESSDILYCGLSNAEKMDYLEKLRIAVLEGDIAELRSLMELPIDPEQQDELLHQYNDLLFQLAAENGHLEILKCLIELTPDPEKRNTMIHAVQDLAFRLAAGNGHLNILEYLIQISPIPIKADITKDRIFAAFEIAVSNNHIEIVQYLLSLVPDAIRRDKMIGSLSEKLQNVEMLECLLIEATQSQASELVRNQMTKKLLLEAIGKKAIYTVWYGVDCDLIKSIMKEIERKRANNKVSALMYLSFLSARAIRTAISELGIVEQVIIQSLCTINVPLIGNNSPAKFFLLVDKMLISVTRLYRVCQHRTQFLIFQLPLDAIQIILWFNILDDIRDLIVSSEYNFNILRNVLTLYSALKEGRRIIDRDNSISGDYKISYAVSLLKQLGGLFANFDSNLLCNHSAFYEVAEKDDIEGLKRLAALPSAQTKVCISYGAEIKEREIFYKCVASGDLDILRYIMNRIKNEHQVYIMIYNNPETFCIAAANGHVDILRYLVDILERHGHIAERHRAIHYQNDLAYREAAKNGHIDALQFLVELTLDLAVRQRVIRFAFQEAAKAGNIEVLKFLLALEPGLDQENAVIHNAFLEAAINNRIEVLEFLAALVPNIVQGNREIANVFQKAAKVGNREVLQFLVDLVQEDLAQIHQMIFNSAFLQATNDGNMEMLQFLTGLVPDLVSQDIGLYTSVIHNAFKKAAAHGHIEVMRFLLDLMPNLAKEYNMLPDAFQRAAAHGHIEVMRFLSDLMPNLAKEYNNIMLPTFQRAAANGYIEVLKFLENLVPTVVHIIMSEAFHSAISNNHVEVVKYLADQMLDLKQDLIPHRLDFLKLDNIEIIEYLLSIINPEKALELARFKITPEILMQAIEIRARHTLWHGVDYDVKSQAIIEKEKLMESNKASPLIYLGFLLAAAPGINYTKLQKVEQNIIKSLCSINIPPIVSNNPARSLLILDIMLIPLTRLYRVSKNRNNFGMLRLPKKLIQKILWLNILDDISEFIPDSQKCSTVFKDLSVLYSGVINLDHNISDDNISYTLSFLRQLGEQYNDSSQVLLCNNFAFYDAVLSCDINELKRLAALPLEQTRFQICVNNSASEVMVLDQCAENGDLDVFRYVINRIKDKYEVYNIILENKEIFYTAAENGQIGILRCLVDIFISTRNAIKLWSMIHYKDNRIFQNAAKNGRIEVVKFLVELLKFDPEKLEKMLHHHDYRVFREAAKNGHLEILQLLVEWTSNVEKREEMIHSHCDEPFRLAEANNHQNVMQYLIERTPDLLQRKEMMDNKLHAIAQSIWYQKPLYIKGIDHLISALTPKGAKRIVAKTIKCLAFGAVCKKAWHILWYIVDSTISHSVMEDINFVNSLERKRDLSTLTYFSFLSAIPYKEIKKYQSKTIVLARLLYDINIPLIVRHHKPRSLLIFGKILGIIAPLYNVCNARNQFFIFNELNEFMNKILWYNVVDGITDLVSENDLDGIKLLGSIVLFYSKLRDEQILELDDRISHDTAYTISFLDRFEKFYSDSQNTPTVQEVTCNQSI